MELIDITPEDSFVPVYLELLSEEEQEKRNFELLKMQQDQEDFEANIFAKNEARASGIAKLISLGLTEEEAVAIVNG